MTDCILLGRIKGAHGIRGEVIIASFADLPEDVAAYGPLSDESGKRAFDLSIVRVTPKGVVARIKGVNDRTAAEQLAGIDLYIERAKLPPAEDDAFYHADLIGLDVVSPDGVRFGTIAAVENYGAGDLLEIRLDSRTKTELVPFTDACVPTVDLAARRVTVILPVASPDDGPHTERDDNVP